MKSLFISLLIAGALTAAILNIAGQLRLASTTMSGKDAAKSVSMALVTLIVVVALQRQIMALFA